MERRSFPRSDINCFIWYSKSDNEREKIVVSRNISPIGSLFLTEEYIPCNTKLNLRLRIPNVKEPLNLRAEVVRAESATGLHFYKTAVKFNYPSSILNKYLSRN